jgi:hypothetical protein
MATANPTSLKHAGNQAARQAKHLASGGWVERLERLGYVARGTLYIIMGALALQLALGAGGQADDPVGALRYVAQQPYGKILLVVMIVGLAGYSLWGFVRALFDALHKGSDLKGLVQRFGYLISAVSYGVLIIPAWQLLMSKAASSGGAGSPAGITAQLMSKPYGIALVYAFGAFWVIAAIGQFISAITASFMRDLRWGKMSKEERHWAEIIGRIGYAARGVVYSLLAWFILQAAYHANPKQAQGIDGVLRTLAKAPYGHFVLAVVAAGLVIFGIYSVMGARWYSVE